MNENIVEWGPCRVIGVSYIGPIDQGQIPKLWEDKLFPRCHEITKEKDVVSFGICRCVEGATDGQFEYIAALGVQNDTPVPEGMVAVDLPAQTYYRLRVPNLSEIGKGWEDGMKAISELNGWKACCGADGCKCAESPCFELYPADFTRETGALYLYFPLERAN